MTLQPKLWKLWLRVSAFVNKRFEKFYQETVRLERSAALAAAVKHADEFLAYFRKRSDYEGFNKVPRHPVAPKNCLHVKGGPRLKPIFRDYAVAQHTFINGRTKIWCLLGCGFVSWNGDKNWKKARQMVELSSNRPSSSERVPNVRA
jgi:hypothetical protein